MRGLFLNVLISDGKSSHQNGEKFPKPIEMQLSKKANAFSQTSTKNSVYFFKKDEPHTFNISKIIDSGRCRKSPVSEYPSEVRGNGS